MNFRIKCSRSVTTEVTKPFMVAWEDDFFNEFCKLESEKWSDSVNLVQNKTYKYDISSSFIVDNPVDQHVRRIHIQNSNKLRIYALFKKSLEVENYMSCISDVSSRKLLARFRMGVSTLRIETGRYEANGTLGRKGIPIEYRICKCCNLKKVEDEIHFLIE